MRSRRTIAAIALTVAAPFALSACGTSFNAQTNQQYQAGVGSNLRTGPIHVYNGLFVANDEGDGKMPSATFSGALLSAEPQKIIQLSVTSGATTASFPPYAPIELEANKLKTLGADGEFFIQMETVEPGAVVTVTFESASGDVASLEVPVVERTKMYADVATKPAKKKESTKTQATEAAPEGE
ncbi:MAG TPA: hypothetical protein PLQ19_10260 [Aeromicrobium sp.]|nr:hypothetical protein [Aeromicrobium sp.]